VVLNGPAGVGKTTAGRNLDTGPARARRSARRRRARIAAWATSLRSRSPCSPSSAAWWCSGSAAAAS